MSPVRNSASLAVLAAIVSNADGFVPLSQHGRGEPVLRNLRYQKEDTEPIRVTPAGEVAFVPRDNDVEPPSQSPQKRSKRPGRRVRGRRSRGVQSVDTVEEFEATVFGDESETRLTLVRFYAPYCRACKAALPQYEKMTSKYSDKDVRFVDMPLTEDSDAKDHGWLGVPSVPYTQIYHPHAGLVEGMKMNKADFPAVLKVLDDYLSGSCALPLFDLLDDLDDEEWQESDEEMELTEFQ